MITIPRHNSAFSGLITKILDLKKGDHLLDLTLGDGGHTQEALEAGAIVTSFDVDKESIKRAKTFVPKKYHSSWTIINSNMTKVKENLSSGSDTQTKFQAILIDLGPSQYQVLSPDRGFSFDSQKDLDMRLDKSLSVTAKDLLQALGPKELEKVFSLADESRAKKIATAIVSKRQFSPIVTGQQLADLVTKIKGYSGKTHPATQVFMGLRMVVNLEREVIKETLPQLPGLLKKGGKLAVISFHSGEDRLVKQFGKDQVESQTLSVIYKKPLCPTDEEIKKNPRVRSAKLRLFEKI
jgi:16S rRNA (cytosine1402-N4)-methyltransferase